MTRTRTVNTGIRTTETALHEWGVGPRRDERGQLYQLISGDDALCAKDPVRNRWMDGRSQSMQVLCSRCPLREPCLDYALLNDVDGVWGGTTEAERRDMRGPIKAEPLRERWARL